MIRVQGVTATGVIVKDDKVLLIKRREDEDVFPGKWEMPSGKVEFGEDPKKALQREVREEVGLTVKIRDPIYVFSYVLEKEDREKHTVEICFLADLEDESQSVRLSREHTAFAWVSKDRLPNYLEGNDPIRAAAEKALAG